MTKARPRLTEIVDAARDRDEATALTEYERPRAVVVSVPFFERAERAFELAALLADRAPELHAELTASSAWIGVPARLPAER
jgi:hypothetical protein